LRALLRRPSFYLAFPILMSCLSTFASFDLPAAYLAGIFLLAGAAAAIVALDFILNIRLPPASEFQAMDFAGSREGFVALAFAAGVTVFCLIDVTLFPIPLIVDPSSYATFEGGRAGIRHVSNMSWVLPPIALLCLRSRMLRGALVAIGFIFPILVIDRNRLMAALFSFLLVLVLRRKRTSSFPWKTVGVLSVTGAGAFSLLGILRSGSLDYLPLPFSGIFRASPASLKWLFLYSSAGVYNFASIMAKDYRNADFLTNQIVPLGNSVATLGTGIPLDAETVNVGTEFFPFLMAFGWGGALFSIFALYAMLLWSVKLLEARVTLFALLIFLRIAYVCFTSPFAPQAFTWTNFGFLALCILSANFAIILPRRTSHPDETRA
jgi:hypothetical protein